MAVAVASWLLLAVVVNLERVSGSGKLAMNLAVAAAVEWQFGSDNLTATWPGEGRMVHRVELF